MTEMIEGEALDGSVDIVKPWTVKAVSIEVRELANSAARREGLTVSHWLERTIRAAASDESAQVGPRLLARSYHTELRELVAMARDLTPPDKDTEVMRIARATVRDRLKAIKG